MEIILLQKIRNLGNLGARVKVKPGFARNFLIPKEMAVPFSEKRMQEFEARRAELEAAAAEMLASAQARAEKLIAANITIAAKALDEGKLYGSIGVRELSIALKEAGFDVEKHEIQLPAGPIRLLGEYDVDIELHSDVALKVKVNVIAE